MEDNDNKIMYDDNTDNINNFYDTDDEQYRIQAEILRKRRERRREANRRRVRRNRIVALIILAIIVILCFKFCGNEDKETKQTDTKTSTTQPINNTQTNVTEKFKMAEKKEEKVISHNIENRNGMTFVDGILIVNKTYSLPSTYAPGVSAVAQNAFDEMVSAAAKDGITLYINSSYRSYDEQKNLYDGYAYERGTEEADKVSSRPGHSEHQTGLAFDVNTTELSFEGTPEAEWLANHCHEYGFIIRFPKGKEAETGYIYEPWHIRYLGKENAEKVYKSGLSLESYLGITSDYAYAEDM